MNDRMPDSEIVELERSLRAVAEEDGRAQAPPHVHAAVMQTWDLERPFAQRRRRGRSRNATLLAIGSVAATIVAVVAMYRASPAPSRPEPVVAPAAEQPRVVTTEPRPEIDVPAEAHRPRPRRPRTRGETTAPRYAPGMALVADPILDAKATSIVRVRVPRHALVMLGIPVVEPDDGGSVDLEMLVGEDGVAQTIRRAVPVVVRQE